MQLVDWGHRDASSTSAEGKGRDSRDTSLRQGEGQVQSRAKNRARRRREYSCQGANRGERGENQIRILGPAGRSVSRLGQGDTTLSHAPLGKRVHGVAHIGPSYTAGSDNLQTKEKKHTACGEMNVLGQNDIGVTPGIGSGLFSSGRVSTRAKTTGSREDHWAPQTICT